MVFSCRHLTCVPCFADYCRSKMGERQFVLDPDLGYTLPCPIGCEGSLINEPRHFKLLGKDVYNRSEPKFIGFDLRFDEFVLCTGMSDLELRSLSFSQEVCCALSLAVAQGLC